jgi:FKBP-type peptidyl-prolyl cis-trans isomerase FkpA
MMMKKNISFFKSIWLLLYSSYSVFATAQTPATSTVAPPIIPPPNITYKTLNSKLQYAFIVNKPTSPSPKEGDQISVHMLSVSNNRIMYDSKQTLKGKPAIYGVTKPAFKGDLIEAIMLMTPGDSIVCLVDADAIFKGSKSKMPDFIKVGDKVQYFIRLVSIKTKEALMKEQQAAFEKQMKAMEAKQKADAAKFLLKEDKLLKAYFVKNQLNPIKTKSGLYYLIKEDGKGDLPMVGDNVSVNYTGTLLDGQKFDSNTDTAFKHVEPLQFTLGQGAVIKGWDEGLTLLKPGTKATLFIPSPLAYGAQSRPGSAANPKGIPANSILLFDVELISSTKPAAVAPTAPVKLEVPKTDSIKKE